MNLEQLKKDCIKKQKKGIHFILASIVIWTMVLMVQLTSFPILTNKKSINILLYSTIIANIVFNIQNIENTISR